MMKNIKNKGQKKSKKKSSNISLTDEEMQKQKASRKKIVFFVLIIVLLLIAIAIEIMVLIPKIKLNGDKIVKVEYGNYYQDPGCTATHLGINISNKIWYEGEVDEEKCTETYNYNAWACTLDEDTRPSSHRQMAGPECWCSY